MSPDRKKTGMGFWITVVVLIVLVLYPLSFGPGCWIASRSFPARSHFFQAVFWPIGKLVYVKIPVVDRLIVNYAYFCLPKGGTVLIPGGPDENGAEVAVQHM